MKTFLHIIKLIGIIGDTLKPWLAIVLLVIQIGAAVNPQPEPPPGWASIWSIVATIAATSN